MKRALVLFTAIIVLVWSGLPVYAATEITVSTPFGSGDAFEGMKAVVDGFNNSQNRLKVNLITVAAPDTIEDKLITLFLSGEAPDVAMVADLSMASYATSGILTPLDSYIKASKIKPSDYWAPVWQAGQYEGKHWTMPMSSGVRLLYANKDLLNNNGVGSMPKTIAQMDSTAAKLTRRLDDGKYEQVGFVPWRNDGGIFHTWAWAFGGSFYDEANRKITANDQRNIQALEWLAKYGLTYPNVAAAPNNFTENRTLGFIVANSYLMTEWKRTVPDFKYEVSMIPVPDGLPPSTWSGSWMWAIPRGAKNADASWEFIQYAIGVNAQIEWVKRNFMPPVNMSAMKQLVNDLVGLYGPGVLTAFESMAYTHFRPKVPIGPRYWAETQNLWGKVVNQGQEPKALLENITRTMQAELDQAFKNVKK